MIEDAADWSRWWFWWVMMAALIELRGLLWLLWAGWAIVDECWLVAVIGEDGVWWCGWAMRLVGPLLLLWMVLLLLLLSIEMTVVGLVEARETFPKMLFADRKSTRLNSSHAD